jgi:hypothetical protein
MPGLEHVEIYLYTPPPPRTPAWYSAWLTARGEFNLPLLVLMLYDYGYVLSHCFVINR